jgi:hypothetical protein
MYAYFGSIFTDEWETHSTTQEWNAVQTVGNLFPIIQRVPPGRCTELTNCKGTPRWATISCRICQDKLWTALGIHEPARFLFLLLGADAGGAGVERAGPGLGNSSSFDNWQGAKQVVSVHFQL